MYETAFAKLSNSQKVDADGLVFTIQPENIYFVATRH
jgi:hypothetical protein